MKAIGIIILTVFLSACNHVAKTTNAADSPHETNLIETLSEEEETDRHVCISEDKRIKIYSGMHPHSGTSPDYYSVWTIVSDKGTQHQLNMKDSPFFDNIHSLQKTDGSTYYIASCYGRASSVDGYEWLQAYKIVGDTIQEVNVADGSPNIEEHEFDINFNIADWYFTTNGAGYDWIFEYDPATRNLYVPIDEDWHLNDRYEVWHFNGERFVHLGEKPHKGLHKSLGNYLRLVCYFTTKDYIVRIDSLESEGLRYASWQKPKTMADKPDMVLTGGYTQEHPAAPDELHRCDDYRVTNGSFEYLVNYCETKRLDNDYGEHHDFLLVKRNGKVILKQEQE
jgi:hypothetical protein